MADFEVSDPRFASKTEPAHVPSAELPENLPPVEPPSAGFIVQLFVVPALIVLAVVAVWALFGRIAGGNEDWRALVADLRGGNEHRRWRAALGLAQTLKADQERGPQGEQLAKNEQVCGELIALFREQLDKANPREDDLKQQAFLARTMGFLDRPELVLPALQDSMQPIRDLDVRRNSLASVSLILGRAEERGEHPADAGLVSVLIESTQDAELTVRQLATYSLGLVPGDESLEQLVFVVDSGSEDASVRANAAVALARRHSTAGVPYFKTVLAEAARPGHDPSGTYLDFVTVRNTVKGIATLKDDLTAGERADIAALLAPIADRHSDPRVRYDAKAALSDLRKSSPPRRRTRPDASKPVRRS